MIDFNCINWWRTELQYKVRNSLQFNILQFKIPIAPWIEFVSIFHIFHKFWKRKFHSIQHILKTFLERAWKSVKTIYCMTLACMHLTENDLLVPGFTYSSSLGVHGAYWATVYPVSATWIQYMKTSRRRYEREIRPKQTKISVFPGIIELHKTEEEKMGNSKSRTKNNSYRKVIY